MTITKILNKERVICEFSYYEWWQATQPTFKDILSKICEECGDDYVVFSTVRQQTGSTIVEENSFTIHGVDITVINSITPNTMEIKTKMKSQSAKHDWVECNTDNSTDLFIPYFETFLSNLRNVWYEQYKVGIGS